MRTTLLILCAIYGTTSGIDAADRPNIIFILADDMGYGDLKPFNPDSKIDTPHLSRLASGGMIFTDAHSGGSTCKPSRYSLMTGRFATRRDQFNDRAGPLIEDRRTTVASMLQSKGYRTAMVGKWHLGFDQNNRAAGDKEKRFAFDYGQPLTGGPLDRGFDSFFGMHASLDIPPYFYIQGRSAVMPPSESVGDSTSVGGAEDWNKIQGAFWRAGDIAANFKHAEVTPRFAEEACSVLESHDRKQPLFLYLALPSPHTPWLPVEKFVGKSGAGMYGDFVMTVDEVVGQVLGSLESSGLADDSLVLFSSDNGPVWYDKDEERFDHQSTGSLRGAKGSVWEGGHRVPFIARWPGKVSAGHVSDRTIAFADVFATLSELAVQSNGQSSISQDSESFLPTLLSTDTGQEPRGPLLHGGKVIRDGDWKLISTKGSRGFGAPDDVKYGPELYNLRDDVAEQNNLIDSMPEKVGELKAMLQEVLDGET